MVDEDLAEMYGVPTKRLNEQVRRNSKRLPVDFMIRLTKDEEENLATVVGAHCQLCSPHILASACFSY
jgi:hypothetical protein